MVNIPRQEARFSFPVMKEDVEAPKRYNINVASDGKLARSPLYTSGVKLSPLPVGASDGKRAQNDAPPTEMANKVVSPFSGLKLASY